jgi:uncharacterized protein YjbI with pentapeptide repeats
MRRMAETPWDPEHLEIVKQGPQAIREWRARGGTKLRLGGASLRDVDLSGADFDGADLTAVDLRGAILRGASLRGADLRRTNLYSGDLIRIDLAGAKLRGVDLARANLNGANLRKADLGRANLVRAQLMRADLSGASLSSADLRGADLSGANIGGVDLTHATLIDTEVVDADLSGARFGDTTVCSDLTSARNLDKAEHYGHSHVDLVTLRRSTPKAWPLAFLRGCGLSDFEIETLASMSAHAIDFYSCFISYSSKDDRFAVKLHDALQAHGVRCWLDKHEVLPGDNIYAKVNEGIRLWDKVLLCCSESALRSWWVKDEVVRALEKERELEKERGHEVLSIIPLDLDGYLFDDARCTQENAPTLRKRHAPRFGGWEADAKVFDAQLERVVKALRTDRPTPPTSKL